MVHVSGIERPSPELKSSFKTKNQFVGFSAEAAVIYLLQKKNWNLEYQRLRTVVAEVDLVFSKDDLVLLIEVKKLNDDWRAFERVGRAQYFSLQKNLVYFSSRMPQFNFESFVCWVNDKNQVSFVRVE